MFGRVDGVLGGSGAISPAESSRHEREESRLLDSSSAIKLLHLCGRRRTGSEVTASGARNRSLASLRVISSDYVMKWFSTHRPEIAGTVLILLFGFAAPVLLMEIGLRLFSKEVRNYEQLRQQGRDARRESIWRRSDDPILVYEHRPHYSKDGVRYTEDHGILSDHEIVETSHSSRFRIAVLGDSISAGLNLSRSEVFPSILRSMLNSDSISSPRTVEVLNFAVNGYRTIQEARLLETKVVRFSPDLVILQYCLNDAGNSLTPTVWFEDRTFYGSHVVRRTVKGLKKFLSPTGPADSYYVPVFGPGYGSSDYWLSLYDKESQSWLSVEESFESVARVSNEIGVPALVVIFPLFLEPDWNISLVQPTHRQVAEAAQEAGLYVLDLLESFRLHPVSELQLEEGDIYHPNGAGHQLAAEEIYRFVRQRIDEDQLDPDISLN